MKYLIPVFMAMGLIVGVAGAAHADDVEVVCFEMDNGDTDCDPIDVFKAICEVIEYGAPECQGLIGGDALIRPDTFELTAPTTNPVPPTRLPDFNVLVAQTGGAVIDLPTAPTSKPNPSTPATPAAPRSEESNCTGGPPWRARSPPRKSTPATPPRSAMRH